MDGSNFLRGKIRSLKALAVLSRSGLWRGIIMADVVLLGQGPVVPQKSAKQTGQLFRQIGGSFHTLNKQTGCLFSLQAMEGR